MRSRVFIPKWLAITSLGLHVAFAVCAMIWLSHRYDQFGVTRTLFSFSELHPADAKPMNLDSCYIRALDTKPAPKTSLLILGDSLVEFGLWSDLLDRPVINHGIGGDYTDCIIYRLPLTVSVAPSSIILLVGINDLMVAKRSPEAIATNYWRILSTLRRTIPETRIYVSSLLPTSGPRSADLPPAKILEMNDWLKRLADEFDASFIDAFPALADTSGKIRAEYSTDGIHLNMQGYFALSAVWKKRLGELR